MWHNCSADTGSIPSWIWNKRVENPGETAHAAAMMWKRLLLVCSLGLSCTHETAASGATDTQLPKSAHAAAPSGTQGEPAGCTSDADCQPVDSYCGGCQCLALPVTASAPQCEGEPVQCFVQPCRGQRAVCRGGGCSLSGGSEM